MACAAALVASCAGWQIKVGESGLYGSITGPDHVTIVAEGFEDALKQEAAHIVKLGRRGATERSRSRILAGSA